MYEINGEFNDCPMYQLHGSDGKTYTLYKWKFPLQDNARFYISIIPDGIPGVDTGDIDYYYTIYMPIKTMSPPTDEWEFDDADEPAPSLRRISSMSN